MCTSAILSELDIFGFCRVPAKNDTWSVCVSNKLHKCLKNKECVCACKFGWVCMFVCTTTFLRIGAHDDESLHAYFTGLGMFGIQLFTHYLSKVL